MSYHSLPREESVGAFQGAPVYVRAAARRSARAYRALGVYRRHGWNPSAASREYATARQALRDALDQWEHEENNPPLF